MIRIVGGWIPLEPIVHSTGIESGCVATLNSPLVVVTSIPMFNRRKTEHMVEDNIRSGIL